jgi:hypothetical protein
MSFVRPFAVHSVIVICFGSTISNAACTHRARRNMPVRTTGPSSVSRSETIPNCSWIRGSCLWLWTRWPFLRYSSSLVTSDEYRNKNDWTLDGQSLVRIETDHVWTTPSAYQQQEQETETAVFIVRTRRPWMLLATVGAVVLSCSNSTPFHDECVVMDRSRGRNSSDDENARAKCGSSILAHPAWRIK